MISTEINGIFYDYGESSTVKLSNEMYEDFCKCCEQEHYSHELLSKTSDYVICNADYHIIEFFISCMKSEHEETIKMLCTAFPKGRLIDKVNGIAFEEDSDYWADTIDISIIKEAIQRYKEYENVYEH
ncbi:hypothetical protein [Ruminococcus sp.]|uniref:hypothetical protein n=1 Tax=Ruminococcus sp. TaxID=41978 RepID=UPI0025CDFCF8|nr:hypothetical protein [Ruminococcus sp.]